MLAVQQIDKDVVRTDRSHPYYKGSSDEGRRHVGTLKSVSKNFRDKIIPWPIFLNSETFSMYIIPTDLSFFLPPPPPPPQAHTTQLPDT